MSSNEVHILYTIHRIFETEGGALQTNTQKENVEFMQYFDLVLAHLVWICRTHI